MVFQTLTSPSRSSLSYFLLKQVQVVTVTSQAPRGYTSGANTDHLRHKLGGYLVVMADISVLRISVLRRIGSWRAVAGSHWHYAQPMGIERLVDNIKVD
jgi:hypothetical protein